MAKKNYNPTNLERIFGGIVSGLRTDTTMPMNKDSTQNPALEAGNKSPGTAVGWVQPIPDSVIDMPDPYDMSPANGQHWKTYYANQIYMPYKAGLIPNAADVLAAVSETANVAADGSHDVWNNEADTRLQMRKNYRPANNFR